jgi:hypothetical protein
VAQLNLKLNEQQVEALRRYAAHRRTPVSWLLRDYVSYLIAGGEPVRVAPPDELSARLLAEAAQVGGSFDWLADEPDLYSLEDGEPV